MGHPVNCGSVILGEKTCPGPSPITLSSSPLTINHCISQTLTTGSAINHPDIDAYGIVGPPGRIVPPWWSRTRRARIGHFGYIVVIPSKASE